MEYLRILSFNVRGSRDFGKRSRICSYIKRFKADVILMQERPMTTQLPYENLYLSTYAGREINVTDFINNLKGEFITIDKRR